MAAAAKTPSCGRMPEDDRWRIMREAAAEVFLREGYAATRMDDIASAAGMSKKTLYARFVSKAALFEAVVIDALEPFHLNAEFGDDPDLAKALASLLEAAARHLLTPRMFGILRLIIAEGGRSPELAAIFHRAGPGSGASALERRIAAEVERGRLRVASPREAANLLYMTAIGAFHFEMLMGLRKQPDAAEITERIQEAVRILLWGSMPVGREDPIP